MAKELKFEKAGPLEQTYFNRHRRKTGCTGGVAAWRGPWLMRAYYCVKCGKQL